MSVIGKIHIGGLNYDEVMFRKGLVDIMNKDIYGNGDTKYIMSIVGEYKSTSDIGISGGSDGEMRHTYHILYMRNSDKECSVIVWDEGEIYNYVNNWVRANEREIRIDKILK